jgi:hypothetical protein
MHAYLFPCENPHTAVPKEWFTLYRSRLGEHPKMFALSMRDMNLTRRILEKLADREDLLIDLGGKRVLLGSDFVSLIREFADWHWLRPNTKEPPQMAKLLL